jgi:hypothetical protein
MVMTRTKAKGYELAKETAKANNLNIHDRIK